ncbi:hypothetical protein MA16_Dca024952 [Dendrobium catenatum]|uniref:Uncharacterized protein n=1 Tax=Dendrobium catenatum TaxID=906689 RepID=A0A2I0VBM0_9ASPA|nr:hypothetical protein MA16_Dca024952 [Dendrobium catenatum]
MNFHKNPSIISHGIPSSIFQKTAQPGNRRSSHGNQRGPHRTEEPKDTKRPPSSGIQQPTGKPGSHGTGNNQHRKPKNSHGIPWDKDKY